MLTLVHTEDWFAHFNFFFLKEYHWNQDSNETEEQLLKKFIEHRVFIERFLPSEKSGSIKYFPSRDIKARAFQIVHGPFLIDHLSITDFKAYKGNQLAKLLDDFKKANSPFVDWESHSKIVEQAFSTIEKYQIEDDQLFYINKDWFTNSSKALTEFGSNYEYYLLFILINKAEKRILMLNYGSD